MVSNLYEHVITTRKSLSSLYTDGCYGDFTLLFVMKLAPSGISIPGLDTNFLIVDGLKIGAQTITRSHSTYWITQVSGSIEYGYMAIGSMYIIDFDVVRF